MHRIRSNWLALSTAAVALAAIATILGLESWIVQPGIVRSMDSALVPNLYQVAVSALLEQSAFFSSWAIGLIVAAWYVMVHSLEKTAHPVLVSGFICVCAIAITSILFGQMLREVVIGSVALGQDPLFNPRSSQLLVYQYWMTVAAVVIVAMAVVGRVVVA